MLSTSAKLLNQMLIFVDIHICILYHTKNSFLMSKMTDYLVKCVNETIVLKMVEQGQSDLDVCSLHHDALQH